MVTLQYSIVASQVFIKRACAMIIPTRQCGPFYLLYACLAIKNRSYYTKSGPHNLKGQPKQGDVNSSMEPITEQ